MGETLAQHLAARQDTPLRLHEVLSDREYELLRLLCEPRTIKEIATTLGVSTKTVSGCRGTLLKKMNMKKNAELIHYVIEHNLISSPVSH